jgi:tRNA (guanine-N7-)-methyltransferase
MSMKPKHLKSPRTWETREVIINDRIWYVPEYYDRFQDFKFPGWDAPELFGNKNPVYVEYCSGNGAWIEEKALSNPLVNWVAVEKKFERVRKIWSKIKNSDIKNLIVICGEGFSATTNYFPQASVSQVFINFPDPWPKRIHAKHRIIKPRFVEEMGRILMGQGAITLVTDDPDYSSIMVECMTGNSSFESICPSPYYQTEHKEYGSSYFDQLWREMGKEIRYHQFHKRADS